MRVFLVPVVLILTLQLLVPPGAVADRSIVFVTSSSHTGNIGGLAGADAICNDLADAAGLPGSYSAWLSTETPKVTASDRIYDNAEGYMRVDETPVADSIAELCSCDWFTTDCLTNAILRDENGDVRSSSVWTGTTSDEGVGCAMEEHSGSAYTCGDWTDDGSAGSGGDSGDADRGWTAGFTALCSQSYRIYCFQNDPALIELGAFTAGPVPAGVLVTWETASEVETAGFNLWRSDAVDGDYAKINPGLIPGEGGPTQGASYAYTDSGCQTRDCFYKLEDIDTAGVSRFHGPIAVEPAAPWSVQTAQSLRQGAGTALASKGFVLFSVILLPAAVLLFWSRTRRKAP